MEEMGIYDSNAMLYGTHLREPIDLSISHFKYQGRCDSYEQLLRSSFIPTEDRAGNLETWNSIGGHGPVVCPMSRNETIFKNGMCAVNCYTQWFLGLYCQNWRIP